MKKAVESCTDISQFWALFPPDTQDKIWDAIDNNVRTLSLPGVSKISWELAAEFTPSPGEGDVVFVTMHDVLYRGKPIALVSTGVEPNRLMRLLGVVDQCAKSDGSPAVFGPLDYPSDL